MSEDLQQFDDGTVLKFLIKEKNVPVNFTQLDIQALILHLEKKDKTVLHRPLGFYNDGTDGWLEYITDNREIDQRGKITGQIFIATTSGSWHTNQFVLEVGDIICEGVEDV